MTQLVHLRVTVASGKERRRGGRVAEQRNDGIRGERLTTVTLARLP